MSVSLLRYLFICISKIGEMRLKNKVGNVIFKENVYEDWVFSMCLDELFKY